LNLDIGRHMWWPGGLSRKTDEVPTEAPLQPSEVAT